MVVGANHRKDDTKMKKVELLALAEKYDMKPEMKVDQTVICYGEPVIVTEHQVGYNVESADLIPELDAIVDNTWTGRFLPVVATRERQPWADNYKYTVYAPSIWFYKEA